MNTKEYMIIIKGRVRTSDIKSCQYNKITDKLEVQFNNGEIYPYSHINVELLKNPSILDPKMYQIGRAGRVFSNIRELCVFKGKYSTYWHICFEDGSERDYEEKDLDIAESCLKKKQERDVFEYLKQIAGLNELKDEVTGEKILSRIFEKMEFVGNDVILSKYLNPSALKKYSGEGEYIPIFPFGCNNSQYAAVKNAMENQISVIQGPPGTGKTQTILNIIANILMQGKTVQVVSYNNSAMENVYEKLSSSKYKLGFIVALLGNSQNKKEFIAKQEPEYPDFSQWKVKENRSILFDDVKQKSLRLKDIFKKQEELACLRQEQAQLEKELQYFHQYLEETDVDTSRMKIKKSLSSKSWMELWQECQIISDGKRKIGFLFKIKYYFKYGITNFNFYKQEISKIITTFQAMYYKEKEIELSDKILKLEGCLKNSDNDLLENMCVQSMTILKDYLADRYTQRKDRKIFTEDDLWKKSYEVLEEYPVILSTTFSARSSLNTNVIYDYIIMDEASQVDVATGALALSSARNAVIVGDTKQLPNVVKEETKKQAKVIFDTFNINEGYQYTKSFLDSILCVMPNTPQTLLREHYRCHPQIINFCNQKFYRGELIIMTEDKGEEDILGAVKTVPGNHVRDHYSQRQIDVIRNEVISRYVTDTNETGIIAPYRNQVQELKREFLDIEISTVHKFQGREKDTIIISTVDDEISDFVDDPYLINVAVSRAKKRLVLVVTGNEQPRERNIIDLMEYIQYNNFEIAESKVYSIFDYLYKQYTKERREYLQRHKRISEYDSENLMYALLEDVIAEERFAYLDVVCHFPMNMLIRNPELLEERECQFAMNPATHIDFLLYNRISKKVVLGIEVDGYYNHKKDKKQVLRDAMKDHILELYRIPLLRLKTNGSGEKEKIIKKLEDILN